MNGVEPLVRLDPPDAASCGHCGDGTLWLSIVRGNARRPSRMALHCTTCTATFDVGPAAAAGQEPL